MKRLELQGRLKLWATRSLRSGPESGCKVFNLQECKEKRQCKHWNLVCLAIVNLWFSVSGSQRALAEKRLHGPTSWVGSLVHNAPRLSSSPNIIGQRESSLDIQKHVEWARWNSGAWFSTWNFFNSGLLLPEKDGRLACIMKETRRNSTKVPISAR